MGKYKFQDSVAAATLVCICVMSFSIRLFSVIKYESVIHEFDPYFNYRVTQFLTKEGFYNLWNWFDDRTWYPLGRVIGGTVYPGLIITAGVMWKTLRVLGFPVDVQEVCVFTAPLFSSFCALSAYGFVKEVKGVGAALLASAFVGIVPSYISRSVAGSFDNEGVAIFALLFVFYLYVKTLNTGSLMWATLLSMSYFYMVMSWGGYSFIINLLPIHCLACIFTGRLTARLYVAFAPLIILGTLLAASIPVVGFNAVLMSEHFGAFLAFAVLHGALLIRYAQNALPPKEYQTAKTLLVLGSFVAMSFGFIAIVTYMIASPTFGWTGRSLSLLDPTYASRFIPIIASVSEHQPPTWSSYLTDINLLMLFMPAGLISLFKPLTDASLFLILYGITSVYFSGVMVRLMLVLAPAVCCISAVAISDVLVILSNGFFNGPSQLKQAQSYYMGGENKAVEETPASSGPTISEDTTTSSTTAKSQKKSKAKQQATVQNEVKSKQQLKKDKNKDTGIIPGLSTVETYEIPQEASVIGFMLIFALLMWYMFHCVYVSAEMYSAPSIVLQTRSQSGAVHVIDDFRESYSWLRHNTDENCKVVSWWDYGYQTTAMANRTVLVDNNTWNNTHIATVGRAMSSPEEKAWKIYRDLDVDYVLVVFGGFIGYPSDDINKFLWMVRIGGGVYPDIKERDYLGPQGYTVNDQAGKAMLESLMYKLSYYKFKEASQMVTGTPGMDRVRGYQIGKMDFDLNYFEEVYTSEHWMVRIYRVLERPLQESQPKNRFRRKKSALYQTGTASSD